MHLEVKVKFTPGASADLQLTFRSLRPLEISRRRWGGHKFAWPVTQRKINGEIRERQKGDSKSKRCRKIVSRIKSTVRDALRVHIFACIV